MSDFESAGILERKLVDKLRLVPRSGTGMYICKLILAEPPSNITLQYSTYRDDIHTYAIVVSEDPLVVGGYGVIIDIPVVRVVISMVNILRQGEC